MQISDPVVLLTILAIAVILWVSVLSHIFIKVWENADKATKQPPREWHEEVTDWERDAHQPEQRDYREHTRRFEDWN